MLQEAVAAEIAHEEALETARDQAWFPLAAVQQAAGAPPVALGATVVTAAPRALAAAFDHCKATRDWEDGEDRRPEWAGREATVLELDADGAAAAGAARPSCAAALCFIAGTLSSV